MDKPKLPLPPELEKEVGSALMTKAKKREAVANVQSIYDHWHKVSFYSLAPFLSIELEFLDTEDSRAPGHSLAGIVSPNDGRQLLRVTDWEGEKFQHNLDGELLTPLIWSRWSGNNDDTIQDPYFALNKLFAFSIFPSPDVVTTPLAIAALRFDGQTIFP